MAKIIQWDSIYNFKIAIKVECDFEIYLYSTFYELEKKLHQIERWHCRGSMNFKPRDGDSRIISVIMKYFDKKNETYQNP